MQNIIKNISKLHRPFEVLFNPLLSPVDGELRANRGPFRRLSNNFIRKTKIFFRMNINFACLFDDF